MVMFSIHLCATITVPPHFQEISLETNLGEEEWHENSEPSEVERLLAQLLVMYNYPWTIQVPASQSVINSLPRIPINDEVFESMF
jgi:hypothetical protein